PVFMRRNLELARLSGAPNRSGEVSMKRSVYAALTAVAGALALTACGQPQEGAETAAAGAPATSERVGGSATFAQVDHARLVNAASEPGQWLTRGGTYYEQHFSQLDQINTDNVSELGLAWWGDYDTNIMQESTPLYVRSEERRVGKE